MKTFLKPFEEMPQVEELREHLKKEKNKFFKIFSILNNKKIIINKQKYKKKKNNKQKRK